MNWKKLLENKSLQKKRISFQEVGGVLVKAEKCLRAAELLLAKDVDESVFKEAYDSMILAGRALMFSLGLKPRTIGSHTITIDFCSDYLGNDFKTLTEKFRKMKKKRNYLIYGIGLIVSKTEAENALKTAKEFVDKISKFIQAKNPQKKLV
ncbi:HEPN domain-containing protein [Patescibacteria group bacterium]|nr:HEPN domain-containing protein [Patescibacteria group bacterium]MBU4162044.1 HEPN domain-containing protein [Patescibacteria group bacterium]